MRSHRHPGPYSRRNRCLSLAARTGRLQHIGAVGRSTAADLNTLIAVNILQAGAKCCCRCLISAAGIAVVTGTLTLRLSGARRIQRKRVCFVRHLVIVIIGVTGITLQVAVAVALVGIGLGRTIVGQITNAVTVGVTLQRSCCLLRQIQQAPALVGTAVIVSLQHVADIDIQIQDLVAVGIGIQGVLTPVIHQGKALALAAVTAQLLHIGAIVR